MPETRPDPSNPFGAHIAINDESLEDQLADAQAALHAINVAGGKGLKAKREGAQAEIDRLEGLLAEQAGPQDDEPDNA